MLAKELRFLRRGERSRVHRRRAPRGARGQRCETKNLPGRHRAHARTRPRAIRAMSRAASGSGASIIATGNLRRGVRRFRFCGSGAWIRTMIRGFKVPRPALRRHRKGGPVGARAASYSLISRVSHPSRGGSAHGSSAERDRAPSAGNPSLWARSVPLPERLREGSRKSRPAASTVGFAEARDVGE